MNANSITSEQLELGQGSVSGEPTARTSDEVVLRHAEWLDEVEEPVERPYLLVHALPTWETIRTTLGSSRTAFDPENEYEQQDRSDWDSWTSTILDAANVPLGARTSRIEYISAIRAMAQRESHVAVQSKRAIRILERALELASRTPEQSAHNSANQSPADVVWDAASDLHHHKHSEHSSEEVLLPDPLPTLLSTGRTTRSGRTTLRARLAQLESWKQDCVHVPHLWLDGAPPGFLARSCDQKEPIGGLSCDTSPLDQSGFDDKEDTDAQFKLRLQDQVSWWEEIVQRGVFLTSQTSQ